MMKTLDELVDPHIKEEILTEKYFHRNLFASQKDRSTVDALYVLTFRIGKKI